MFQLEGRRVETIEGLAAAGEDEALQQAFIHESGVQCGACTPGMIVSASALLKREPQPNRSTIRERLAGNLCRCTGYESIYRSVEVAGRLRDLSDETNAHAGLSGEER
jgi:aerobic-type carbon monoxide dehydrogenase small subunit (CoxS/CutS family)